MPPTARARAGPPTGRELARAAWAFAATILVVAAVTAVVAPDWIGESEAELPNRPLLIFDIFINNLFIVLVPLIGGWLAAGHRLVGHRAIAALFMVPCAAIVLRSLGTIGAVGGADPAWLADAARWWLLEVAALAIAARTGIWLVRNPEQREPHGPRAMRRAVGPIVLLLAAGALIEVLTA
jgi:hypothetical protein